MFHKRRSEAGHCEHTVTIVDSRERTDVLTALPQSSRLNGEITPGERVAIHETAAAVKEEPGKSNTHAISSLRGFEAGLDVPKTAVEASLGLALDDRPAKGGHRSA